MYYILFLPTVKKETASPSKKKKAKSIDGGTAEEMIHDENNQRTPDKKPSNNELKDEAKM
jgi:hypothetical protein